MPVAYFLNLCLSNKSSGHQRKRFTAIINIISHFLSLSSIFPSLTITAFLTLSILRHYPISQLFCLSQALADIHTHRHTFTDTFMLTHTHTHTHTHRPAHTSMRTHTSMLVHASLHTDTHAHACMHTRSHTDYLFLALGKWNRFFQSHCTNYCFSPSDPFVCLGSRLSCF